MVYPPVREFFQSLKLVDYLLVQADKPPYRNYLYIVKLIHVDSIFKQAKESSGDVAFWKAAKARGLSPRTGGQTTVKKLPIYS